MASSIGPLLRQRWNQWSRWPLGKWLFSRMVGRFAPYSGSIKALVVELRPGYARLVMEDRAAIRNHLQSIHAIALVNLGEMVTGLALMNSLPQGMRGILKEIHIQYEKKARGRIVAECHCDIPQSLESATEKVEGFLIDSDNERVAKVTAHWLIGEA